MAGRTMLDRLWAAHRVATLPGGADLLFVDRHYLHDLEAGPRLSDVAARGLRPAAPHLTFAMPDHAISSRPGRTAASAPNSARLLGQMEERTREAGIRLFPMDAMGQGIVHVAAPELGLTLPGMTVVCPDSHTCTHGGLGALAFGIGATEVLHVLATGTIRQRKPGTMRVTFDGRPGYGVTAKDLILAAIGRFGTAAGRGMAMEYAGEAVRALAVEGRLTLCNLSIEMGAKIGFVAPDDTTFDWIAGRDHAPRGARWDLAVTSWRGIASDEDAVFDTDISLDAAAIAPQVTWGTSPEEVVPVDAAIPDPDREGDPVRRTAWAASLAYMGLEAGRPLAGTPVDWVFIGSCANSRLPDLREAAAVLRGRHVAPGLRAWAVPGSVATKRAAEAEGLDRVFRDAGVEWREPGCSMCVAANGEVVEPGQRCVSTANRNFVGRQGPGARTHLASPAMAAAAAVTGRITDVRTLGRA